MRVLLAGHWSLPDAPAFSGSLFGEQVSEWLAGQAAASVLARIKSGMEGAGESLTFDLLPFGPGAEFPGGVVEAGHSVDHDWGLPLLGRLSGMQGLSLEASAKTLEEALTRARKTLGRSAGTVAASTPRPLLGPGGTAFLTPSLETRTGFADAEHVETWRAALKNSWRAAQTENELLLPLAAGAENDPTLVAGSGAGGGSAALLLALGGRVLPAWEVLADHTSLHSRVAEADLVVFVSPHLDAPNIPDSPLAMVASVAAADGTPVVAVAASSSLSRPEQADLGIHGVSTLSPRVFTAGGDPFQDCGRRLGQTWGRGVPGPTRPHAGGETHGRVENSLH